MGVPEHPLPAELRDSIQRRVAELPPLTDSQLDAVLDALLGVLIRAAGR